MDSNVQTLDSKQAFRWKAAWFSLLAPLGSVLIFFLCLWASDHLHAFTFNFSGQLIFGGLLIVQIISLIAGLIGMFAKDDLVKIISLIGILISGVAGFLAFALLYIDIHGIGPC